MKSNDVKPKEPSTPLHKTLTVVGIVMCVILIPILIINMTLIVKSFVNKEEVPSIGGITPLIVLSPSMEPDIMTGDLIFSKDIEPADIRKDNVISFFDPQGSGTSVVTHKVKEVVEKDGKLFFRTFGINNNDSIDPVLVPAENVIGIYTEVRLPGFGNVAMFMQSTAGLIVCVFLPLILLVLYDILRRRRYEKHKDNNVAELMAELEALKAAQASAEAAPVTEESHEPSAQQIPEAEAPPVPEPEASTEGEEPKQPPNS